ncbi:MAG TPA: hypothetical protein VFW66_07555 [Gemmatimonadales bacterium]|nr:hypothetical protein [Gemmatimonadales bacterium]
MKRGLYLDAHVVERWRAGDERPEILAERLEWRPDRARPALSLDLPALLDNIRR